MQAATPETDRSRHTAKPGPHAYPSLFDPPQRGQSLAESHRENDIAAALSLLMDATTVPLNGDGFNHAIPCGYTYLAQFAAHDMTLNSRPLPDAGGAGGPDNLRARPLMLDALYGGGPQALPHCHAQPDDPTEPAVKLRLEPVRIGSRKGPKRDIGRLMETANGRLRCIPLIADARNDDNAVISQVTALFIQVHNAAADRMPANWKAEERYLGARLATTAAYRSILRNDLLARLLDPATYGWYARQGGEGRFLARNLKDRPVTAEFAHSVWRMGHAMVRPEYRFNLRSESHPLDMVIERNAQKRPREMPFDREWIAQWPLFFDFGKRKPQPSMLIGPSFAGPLHRAFKLPSEGESGGLAKRDFQRGSASAVASVAHLRERIATLAPAAYPNRAWLTDGRRHHAIVRAYLDQANEAGRLTKSLVQSIISEPPLGFFILVEAAAKPWCGRTLGPLGSMIAAETFFLALDDETSLAGLAPHPDFGVTEALRAAFGDVPQSMPALIRWLDRQMPATEKRLPDGRPLPLI